MALHNGSASYGYPVFYPDGEVEFVSLIGARFPNGEGVPTYPKEWFLPLIIHEYTHSYINPLIKSMPKEFRELGEALLDKYESQKDNYPDIESFLPQIKNYFENYLSNL